MYSSPLTLTTKKLFKCILAEFLLKNTFTPGKENRYSTNSIKECAEMIVDNKFATQLMIHLPVTCVPKLVSLLSIILFLSA